MKKKLIFVGAMLVVSSDIIAQQENEKQIEEVTIASKTAQQLHRTGKNVQLISAKDLEKHKGSTLTEVLNQAAGFQIGGNFNNNSEPKSFKIRGGENKNVLILIDGVPLKDVTGNDYTISDLRMIALENIQSIEILNGASSVLYGSNASSSVINITMKQNSQKPFEGQIGLRGGSFATFAQNVSVKGKLQKFNYQVSGANEKSDGISAAQGKNFDKDGYDKQSIFANVGFQENKFSVQLNGGYNHHNFDFDNGAFQDGKNQGKDEQYFVGSNLNYAYKNGKVFFNTRYSVSDRKSDYVDFATQYGYNGENFFSELYNQYQFSENLKAVAGVQFETQRLEQTSMDLNTLQTSIISEKSAAKNHNFDAFVNFNFQARSFHLDAGTRLITHSEFGNHLVYSVNPYYLRDFGSLYFKVGISHSTAFIAPTVYQNFGSLPYPEPNFDLKPETNSSQEIDLSFGKTDRSFVFNASLFQRKEKDVFAYVTLPNWNGQFQNIDENIAKGFELGFDYKLNEMLKFGGNFSFAENSNRQKILRQPKQRANSYVEILPFKGNRIALNYNFVSDKLDNYQFPPQFVNVQDYSLFGVNISQKINQKFDTYLNLQNVFDRKYTDVIGYTTKPFNFMFGVNYKF